MALSPDFGLKLAQTYGKPSAFAKLVFGTAKPDLPGLHAGQRRYAKRAVADTNFLLPGNSWGKTEFIIRYSFYLSYWKEGPARPQNQEDWMYAQYKGLIASYAYPIAKESFDRFLSYYKSREEVRAIVQNYIVSDPPRVTFTNGSIIDWGSLDSAGKLVEAARRNFIFVDEAGHIPRLKETFTNILYPRTMGVGGRVHLFGTPKAESDPYLMEIFQKGRKGDDPFYYAQEGSVFENEYWTEQERERVLRNPEYVKGWKPCDGCERDLCFPRYGGHPILTLVGGQVVAGRFVQAGGLFFNREYTRRLFTGDWHRPLEDPETHFAEGPIPGHLYMAAFDLAGNRIKKRKKGRGSDATVGFVIDYTEKPWRIVRWDYLEGGSMDWEGKYQLMSEVFHSYNLPYLLIDATGQVDSVQEALQSRGVEVEGIQFGGASNRKFDMLRNLQLVLEMDWGSGERGLLRSPLLPKLKYELDHYVIPDDDIEQDCVMALAMVAHHCLQWDMPPVVAGDVY